MFAKLSSAWAGGAQAQFPYQVENTVGQDCWGSWKHYQVVQKDNQKKYSLFKLTSSDPQVILNGQNCIKKLKLVRHPNILKFVYSCEWEEQGKQVLNLVTDEVQPLKISLSQLKQDEVQRLEYFALGYKQVIEALSFLNNECKMIHYLINAQSIVVTPAMDWKLAGFDYLGEHVQDPNSFPRDALTTKHLPYQPPEIGKNLWEDIAKEPCWAVDAWGLGCFLQELFSEQPIQKNEQLRNLACLPKGLQKYYQKLLSTNPAKRINPKKVLESEYFENRLIDAVQFLENLVLKDANEKDQYFKKLPSLIQDFPPAFNQKKILPLVQNCLEYGGAPSSALGLMLHLSQNLSDSEYQSQVIPTLTKLFMSPDRTIRRSLLESMQLYVKYIDTKVCEEQIYPNIQGGFMDQSAYIRELTLKSMLYLAPKLSQKVVSNQLLKHVVRLQQDPEASLRANSIVLLGNMAKQLGNQQCSKVLPPAFSIAIKDNFIPCRVSSLKVMIITIHMFKVEDIVTKLLPMASRCSIDGEEEVRENAIKCLEVQLQAIKEYHRQLKEGISTENTIQSNNSYLSLLPWSLSSVKATAPAPLPLPTPTPTNATNSRQQSQSLQGEASKSSLTMQQQQQQQYGSKVQRSSSVDSPKSKPVNGDLKVGQKTQAKDYNDDGWDFDDGHKNIDNDRDHYHDVEDEDNEELKMRQQFGQARLDRQQSKLQNKNKVDVNASQQNQINAKSSQQNNTNLNAGSRNKEEHEVESKSGWDDDDWNEDPKTTGQPSTHDKSLNQKEDSSDLQGSIKKAGNNSSTLSNRKPPQRKSLKLGVQKKSNAISEL